MTASSAASSAPFFDPWAYVAGGDTLRAACRTGDIGQALAILHRIPASEELAAAMWAVAEHEPSDERHTAAIERADDGSPVAATLIGIRYVLVGWEIRSALRAPHVSADQFRQFHAWLRRAEGVLFDVCSRFPRFVPAWEVRITSSRGLELGASETRRRYDRLAALEPHHVRAQGVLLQQILPKWGGSWEEASAFVSACTGAAPAGSLCHLLVVDYAIERWLDDDSVPPPEMVDQVRNAARWSVWHPEHVTGHRTARAHADLAHFFSLAGVPADAAPHFDRLGEHPAEGNFRYYRDPEDQYRKLRDAAARAAARAGGAR